MILGFSKNFTSVNLLFTSTSSNFNTINNKSLFSFVSQTTSFIRTSWTRNTMNRRKLSFDFRINIIFRSFNLSKEKIWFIGLKKGFQLNSFQFLNSSFWIWNFQKKRRKLDKMKQTLIFVPFVFKNYLYSQALKRSKNLKISDCFLLYNSSKYLYAPIISKMCQYSFSILKY